MSVFKDEEDNRLRRPAARSIRKIAGARPRKVSLRTRLLTLAAVVMTLVIAERTVSIVRLRADSLRIAEDRVMDLVERSVGRYEGAISVTRAVLLTLASDPHLVGEMAAAYASGATSSQDEAPCAALTPVSNAIAEIDLLSVVDSAGIVRCSSVPVGKGLDVSGRSFIRVALRGIPNIESVRRSLLTDQPGIYAAQPVVAPDGGGVVAVIVARMNLTELFPTSDFTDLGPRSEVALIGPEGTVLSSIPEGTYGLGLDLSDTAPAAQALMRTRGTVLATGADGVLRVYGFSRLPGTNMHLLMGLDEVSVTGPAERAAWSAGLTMLVVGLAILIGLGLIGERLIVAPIRQLANHLIRFGHGDATELKADVLISELQPLAVAFESMANELTARETALRNANRRLNSLASLDALTGIPNRRSFDAVLPLQWNSLTRLAILLIDIDNFKKYNDHYGHKEGDVCIRAVAQTLAASVRGSDMAARIGGEEFAVLMPEADIAAAGEAADRLRRAVEALAIPHITTAGVVTVSVGVAACQPSPAVSPSELFVAADQALYAAKRAGRNAVRRAEALIQSEPPPDPNRPGLTGNPDAGG